VSGTNIVYLGLAYRRRGPKFTTELTRWRRIVEIQNITYSASVYELKTPNVF